MGLLYPNSAVVPYTSTDAIFLKSTKEGRFYNTRFTAILPVVSLRGNIDVADYSRLSGYRIPLYGGKTVELNIQNLWTGYDVPHYMMDTVERKKEMKAYVHELFRRDLTDQWGRHIRLIIDERDGDG